MERQYAVGLRAGDRVDAVFALRAKEMRASRTGEAYLSLEFGDRSGGIGGIMFRPGREAESIPTGTVVLVRGTVTAYRGVLRISVETVRPASRYDLREIMPAGPRDTDEMLEELRDHVRAIGDRGLGLLVRTIFADREFMKRFKSCPATRSDHHAYIGGLLEHTVAVAGICRTMADLHPQIDADLLLAGALLHDIGVVDTLEFQTSIELTDRGRLLGAAVLGERRLAASAAGGTPDLGQVGDQLAHMILSHEVETTAEGGLRPCTLEATVLARAHALDARSAEYIAAGQRAGAVGESWTGDGARVIQPRVIAPGSSRHVAGTPQYARSA
ncbi:MAG: HD domain-containing protein [Coriobacteriia bacterium]|nr:HD domain-containing protein [Coriobacteriia bacterium]MBN2839923.1 HD domain-containing protein [Coriobacteriia bacterium]